MSKRQDEFNKFHKENPNVWELFVKFTFDVIRTGRKNYSVNAVFERIRWHTDIETTGKQFKLSNNHRAYYARYFHEKYPEYDGFFRTKQLRSVA
jgi:hypothetical protein